MYAITTQNIVNILKMERIMREADGMQKDTFKKTV